VDILSLIENFLNELMSLGYIGMFLISLIASSIPFLPLPYLIIIIISASEYDTWGLILLSFFAGLGGSIGKLTTYFLGRGTNLALSKEKRKQLEVFRKMIRKYGTIAVFIFAITPLPDDILYFPLGVSKFDIGKFFIANASGKILLSIIVALIAKTYYDIAKKIMGESLNIYTTIIAIIAAAIVTIILLKVNWSRVYEIIEKEGIAGLLKRILRKVFKR